MFLEGSAPPGTSLLTFFAGKPVGGGSTNANGQYRIPLRAQERPGIYEVEVRLRQSRALVDRFQCYVDVPFEAAPTATPEIVVTSAPQPTEGPGGGATATPTITPTNPSTGGAAPTAAVSATTAANTTTTATPRTSTTTRPTGSAGGTPSPTTTPTTRPTNVIVEGEIEIIEVAYGDPQFPDEEYVQIVNGGDNDLDIAGWKLINATRSSKPTYTFPRYTFLSGNVILVWTGDGTDDLSIGDFYWGRDASVWSVGDVAELRDPQDRLIDTFTVSD